jgi:hypothetical protein
VFVDRDGERKFTAEIARAVIDNKGAGSALPFDCIFTNNKESNITTDLTRRLCSSSLARQLGGGWVQPFVSCAPLSPQLVLTPCFAPSS